MTDVFFLTNTVADELGGAGIGQAMQQQDTHSVSDGSGQGVVCQAPSCPEQFQPYIQDRSLQRFIWVKQGREQVLQHGRWSTEVGDRGVHTYTNRGFRQNKR